MSTNWETADVLEAPMEIASQFDYAISIDKIRNLYSKAKRLQWGAERGLDWDVELDAAKPIIDEGRFAYDLKDLMMPALVRIGAVTPRTRQQFLDAGIPVYEDASVLESMEDGATGDIDFSEAAREFED
jgi:hypothetical protein